MEALVLLAYMQILCVSTKYLRLIFIFGTLLDIIELWCRLLSMYWHCCITTRKRIERISTISPYYTSNEHQTKWEMIDTLTRVLLCYIADLGGYIFAVTPDLNIGMLYFSYNFSLHHNITIHPEIKAEHFGARKLSIAFSHRLIVQHFPIINRPCSVPFIFKAVYLPLLPVLCVLCLYRRERTTQADLSIKRLPQRQLSIHLRWLSFLLSSMSNHSAGIESNC